jgi:hypothetical protein
MGMGLGLGLGLGLRQGAAAGACCQPGPVAAGPPCRHAPVSTRSPAPQANPTPIAAIKPRPAALLPAAGGLRPQQRQAHHGHRRPERLLRGRLQLVAHRGGGRRGGGAAAGWFARGRPPTLLRRPAATACLLLSGRPKEEGAVQHVCLGWVGQMAPWPGFRTILAPQHRLHACLPVPAFAGAAGASAAQAAGGGGSRGSQAQADFHHRPAGQVGAPLAAAHAWPCMAVPVALACCLVRGSRALVCICSRGASGSSCCSIASCPRTCARCHSSPANPANSPAGGSCCLRRRRSCRPSGSRRRLQRSRRRAPSLALWFQSCRRASR